METTLPLFTYAPGRMPETAVALLFSVPTALSAIASAEGEMTRNEISARTL